LTLKHGQISVLIDNIFVGKTNSPARLATVKKPKFAGATSKTQKENNKTSLTTQSANKTQSTAANKEDADAKAAKAIRPRPAPAAKFNYIHRISYSGTLKLLQIYFCNDTNKMQHEFDEKLDDFVERLRANDKFHNYLMKVVCQHLELLLAEAKQLKLDALTESIVYDCESYNEKQVWDYLYQIWMLVFYYFISIVETDWDF
jgi:hypothetical protein